MGTQASDEAVGAGGVREGGENSKMSLKPRFSPQQQQENVSRKQIGEFLELHGFVTGDTM